jgi:hypothetical protein
LRISAIECDKEKRHVMTGAPTRRFVPFRAWLRDNPSYNAIVSYETRVTRTVSECGIIRVKAVRSAARLPTHFAPSCHQKITILYCFKSVCLTMIVASASGESATEILLAELM